MNQSKPVPYIGLDSVEIRNKGKRVDYATLTVVSSPALPDSQPNRHVVSIHTVDESVYRYQRYGFDEPLSYYERERPDGTHFQQRRAPPANVAAVVDAINSDDDSIRPDEESLWAAEIGLGIRGDDYTATTGLSGLLSTTKDTDRPAVTDGGESLTEQATDAERHTTNQ